MFYEIQNPCHEYIHTYRRVYIKMSIQSILNNPLHMWLYNYTQHWVVRSHWEVLCQKYSIIGVVHSHKLNYTYMGSVGIIEDKRCMYRMINLYCAYCLCRCVHWRVPYLLLSNFFHQKWHFVHLGVICMSTWLSWGVHFFTAHRLP